jgi:hypothetical protein
LPIGNHLDDGKEKAMKITDNPVLNFSSLEDEQYRTYEFDGGFTVRIDRPLALNVSKSGGHRVLDSEGVSHYIPAGWKHLAWKVKDGKAAFAF